MNFIVACPDCGKPTLVQKGAAYQSELVITEEKKCPSCGKDISIKVNIKATIKKPEEAKKS